MELRETPTSKTEFSETVYYQWKQVSTAGWPECVREKGRHAIIGFRLKEVPEFNEIQDYFANKNYTEGLLRQKTMIDTVSAVFFNQTKNLTGYLELRLANDIEKRTVNCYLLLRLILTNEAAYFNLKRLAEEFRTLIPDEYDLVQLSMEDIQALLSLHEQNLVEICKATNFLPVGTFFQEETLGVAPRNLIEWDLRMRYNVPCVSYIEPKGYNFANLYKLLQNTREPVQLRISIGSAGVFEVERNIALQYHNMVRLTYSSVATPEINGNINALSKYISLSKLYSLKMQVAARNEVTAMSVANAFCGQLSYGDIKTQINLTCFSLKHIDETEKKLDWESCNHIFYDLNSSLIHTEEVDEAISVFIHRMPYLSDGSEAMAVFRLPVANVTGLPGVATKPIKPFYQPGPKEKPKEDSLQLGHIVTSSNSQDKMPFGIPLSDLTKHGLIVGATGSGKTNTTLNFIKQLIGKDIPFLLLEPVKSEYYEKLFPLFKGRKNNLHRFQLSNPRLSNGSVNPEFLRFNPFIAQAGISTFQHISYIKSCIMAAFPMYGIMPMVLEDCLYEYVKQGPKTGQSNRVINGLSEDELFDPLKTKKYWVNKKRKSGAIIEVNNDYWTLQGFSGFVSQYLKDNEKLFDSKIRVELEGSLGRRMVRLTKGLLGQVFCPEKWRETNVGWSVIDDNMLTILNKSCIIELEGIPENEDKALIMAFILSYLFENRQLRPSHSPANEIHVTIIEEAHRLLSSTSVKVMSTNDGSSLSQDSGSKSISLFVDMLAEIRAKNEAIFVVEQSPAKLVADVIKNTNLKIMHRLTNKSDRVYLGEAMNMEESQSRYATTLQQGEALVFEEQLDKPVLVKMDSF
jgi:hypothetical protein